MNLLEYLNTKTLSVLEFSHTLDHSRAHISGVVNGRLKPSRKLARRIEKETNGEVTMEELLKGW